ncbi:MAG: hypothetical protein HY735_21955 [Verrucomicrobia bacterium]|nr:hypothetical protein [Verrucomicrobiota bacterium]
MNSGVNLLEAELRRGPWLLNALSGKVTFLVYDDFEGEALPELHHRIKVNLKTRWVQAFDHRGSGQLLYFKERFLAPDHPRLGEMTGFSAKLRKLGVCEENQFLENGGRDENTPRLESATDDVQRIKGVLLFVGKVERDFGVNRDERTAQRRCRHR